MFGKLYSCIMMCRNTFSLNIFPSTVLYAAEDATQEYLKIYKNIFLEKHMNEQKNVAHPFNMNLLKLHSKLIKNHVVVKSWSL